jgi:hypothetical protein
LPQKTAQGLGAADALVPLVIVATIVVPAVAPITLNAFLRVKPRASILDNWSNSSMSAFLSPKGDRNRGRDRHRRRAARVTR